MHQSIAICASRRRWRADNARIVLGATFLRPDAARQVLCNNQVPRCCKLTIEMLSARVSQGKRIVLWAVLCALATLLSYIAFRGYLTPDFLIIFSNAFRC